MIKLSVDLAEHTDAWNYHRIITWVKTDANKVIVEDSKLEPYVLNIPTIVIDSWDELRIDLLKDDWHDVILHSSNEFKIHPSSCSSLGGLDNTELGEQYASQ